MDKKKARALEKAKASRQRSIEKQLAKRSCPEYKAHQLEKKRQQREKQRDKQLAKLKEGPTPEQVAKRVANVKLAQNKAHSKALEKKKTKS
jgi:hypothetical protein